MHISSGIGVALFVAAVYALDRRNRRKGESGNRQDRCARCGIPLDRHSGQVINVSGYLSYAKGRACAKCYDTVRSRDRIFYPMVYVVVALLMFIAWWLTRA